MDVSRKICTVLKTEDLSATKIEYNPKKFYLMTEDVKISDKSEDDNLTTRTRFAYNLKIAEDSENVEVKQLNFDKGLNLMREYHVIIDDSNLRCQ